MGGLAFVLSLLFFLKLLNILAVRAVLMHRGQRLANCAAVNFQGTVSFWV